MKLSIYRITLVVMGGLSLFGGCCASRISGRYGEGVGYESVDGIKLYRKFHIRSWKEINKDGTYEFASSNVLDSINAIAPDVFNVQSDAHDVQVDLITKFEGVDAEHGLLCGILSLCTVFVLPSCKECEWNCSIEALAEGHGEKLSGICRFSLSTRGSILPWGLVPFSCKEGYQENHCESWASAADIDKTGVIRKTYIKHVAQQLKRHALHLLTTPDVEFNVE